MAGGPLSDDVQDNWPTDTGWVDGQGNKVIPSGASFEEILSKLFSKEVWYTPSISYGWSSTITKAPTSVSISTAQTGNLANATVEAGTIYYFNGATANTSDSTYKVESTGCSNGYKKGEEGSQNSGNYSKTYTCQKSGSYGLTPSVTGFKADTGGTTAISIASQQDGNLAASSTPMYVNDGTNRITVNQTGMTYTPVSSDSFESFTLYAASNMNNYSETYSADVNDSFYEGKSVTASGSKNSSTITGYRKYFYGLLDTEVAASSIDATVIRSLTGSTAAATGTQWNLEIVAGKAQVIIAVPKSQFNSMEVFQVSINDNIQNVPRANWVEVNVPGANGYKPITYVVWSYSTASGSFPANDMYKITFKNI